MEDDRKQKSKAVREWGEWKEERERENVLVLMLA